MSRKELIESILNIESGPLEGLPREVVKAQLEHLTRRELRRLLRHMSGPASPGNIRFLYRECRRLIEGMRQRLVTT